MIVTAIRVAAFRVGVLFLLLFAPAAEARAHNVGQSYLYLQVYEDRVTGRFEVSLADFNAALRLAGTDREITPSNLDEKIGFLRDYYRKYETSPSPRVVVGGIGHKLTLNAPCTRKTLEALFPQGGCKQACRIAGLPDYYCHAC